MVLELNLGEAAILVSALSQLQEMAIKGKDKAVIQKTKDLLNRLENEFENFSNITEQPIDDLLEEEGVDE